MIVIVRFWNFKETSKSVDHPKLITPKRSFWAKLLGLKVDEV